MKRRPILQVEQIFDDGTHPAIVQPLFTEEMRLAVVDTIAAHPVCAGQRDIFEELGR
jgi:hypothetical protein